MQPQSKQLQVLLYHKQELELHAFKKDFKISGENAGLHVLLTARKRQDEEELIKKAAEKGIQVYGMTHFRIQEEGQILKEYPATIILGYGGLKETQIREGIARLKDAWLQSFCQRLIKALTIQQKRTAIS